MLKHDKLRLVFSIQTKLNNCQKAAAEVLTKTNQLNVKTWLLNVAILLIAGLKLFVWNDRGTQNSAKLWDLQEAIVL